MSSLQQINVKADLLVSNFYTVKADKKTLKRILKLRSVISRCQRLMRRSSADR